MCRADPRGEQWGLAVTGENKNLGEHASEVITQLEELSLENPTFLFHLFGHTALRISIYEAFPVHRLFPPCVKLHTEVRT